MKSRYKWRIEFGFDVKRWCNRMCPGLRRSYLSTYQRKNATRLEHLWDIWLADSKLDQSSRLWCTDICDTVSIYAIVAYM